MKIGKLFGLGFKGLSVPSWLRDFAERWGLGAVIIFDKELDGSPRNIESPQQLRQLCQEIARLPSQPLVLVDQEGGEVCRLKRSLGFAHLPSAKQMSALPFSEQQQLLDASYREMASLGIGLNLAPVIDCEQCLDAPEIALRGRSYHAEAQEVRGYAMRHARAAKQAGLGLCLKHYPGLGAATADTHKGSCRLAELDPACVSLFADLVPEIPMGAVLLSHAIVPAWGELPVSLNRTAIELLATPQAWLISDDLQMQAIQQHYSTEKAIQLAIKAGCQLVLIGNVLMAQEQACNDYANSLWQEAQSDQALASKINSILTKSTKSTT